MDKLRMHTRNQADENFKKLAALFPNAVTESIDPITGEIVRAIDKDVLMQEISTRVVEEREERYQFTWPDKKKAVIAANAPIAATLRPIKENSVGKDGTPGGWDSKNLYIEGDNLEVLKLLQETYLGKVKMIYIDPPYNTGNDFVYEDDFAEDAGEYLSRSGQFDDQGNRMEQNAETNGRFHTDWLNMIYPRIKLCRNLLSEQGTIFISIDNNEIENMIRICDEVFGPSNILGVISNTNNPKGRSDDKFIATAHEYILVYARNINTVSWFGFEPTEEKIIKRYNKIDQDGRKYREIDLRKTGENDLRVDRPNLFYYFYYNESTGEFYPSRKEEDLDGFIQIKPQREDGKEGNWRWGLDTAAEKICELIPKYMPNRKVWGVMQKDYLEGRSLVKPTSSWTSKDVNSERGTEEFIELGFDKRVFPKPKPIGTIKRCCILATEKDDLVIDFFSGSATTAQALLQLNSEDGGKRRFIMVQLPEKTNECSAAYELGFKNICEIGKERIRRAGRKLKNEAGLAAIDLDIGFRVMRLDSSNTEDVFYNPDELSRDLLGSTVDNIKIDRTPEDLLFQVMLDLGVDLSSAIEEQLIDGKKVFIVKPDGIDAAYLVACFDKGVTSETVTEIAQMKPYYAVFRDNGMASDSVATNFDQIFRTYSPQTERKVL